MDPRIWHSLMLCVVPGGAGGRAAYLKKHNVFAGMGSGCRFMGRKVPLYPKMIRMGKNVRIASGAVFYTHDRFNHTLNVVAQQNGIEHPNFKENIGPIEIGDNVAIGGGAIICNNVKIGSNVIILSGSVVMQDIPDNTVVQGNPARKICSIQQFCMIRASKTTYPDTMSARGGRMDEAMQQWLWDDFHSSRRNAAAQTETAKAAGTALRYSPDEMKQMILAYAADAFPAVDFAGEQQLVSQHLLDSLGIITMVSWLSDTFGAEIPYYEVTAENFDSVEAMIRLVCKQAAAAPAAEAAAVKTAVPQTDAGRNTEFAYRSILEAVADHAAKNPDGLCLVDNNGPVTWAEYLRRIRRYAAWFRSLAPEAGSRIIVEAEQSADFLAAELAIQAAGCVFVPLENLCAESKIQALIPTAGASAVLTLKEIAHTAPGVQYVTYQDLKSCPFTADDFTLVLPEKDTVSEILFSTGTTGKEKGIVLNHGNAVAVAENIVFGCDMKRDNIELIPSPMNHSHGLRSYYANMINGSAVILLDSVADMKRFFELIETYHVNSLDLVPSALTLILKLSRRKLADYRAQLRYIEFGSAPMQAADKQMIIEMLPGVPLLNFYGSTESGRATVYNFNTAVDKKGCIGRPTHNTRVLVVDEERREKQSSKDDTGFLASSGPMNMVCYWNDPEETRAAMQDGVVYSKDAAYIDEDGEIILLGRAGDVINIGGKKVAPDEIETAVRKMDCIEDCGCVAMKDPITGYAPRLVVQMKEGCEFDRAAILSFLSGELEPFKLPKKVECIDKIPRTFNGKLLRKNL